MFRRAPEKPTAPTEDRPGFLRRLRDRLNRGDSWLTRDLGDLLRGRQIDAAILEELETRLITADVGVEATERILEGLRRRVARRELSDARALITALRDAIVEILAPVASPLRIDATHRPFVVLVVGVNGSGKTTTIGKLARRCAAGGHSVLMAAGDTFRAAAIEQLKVWAERTAAEFAAQLPGADPGAVVFDALAAARARRSEVVLVDTAGRLHSQSHLMEELKKVKRVIQRFDPGAPHEVLLVLDANQGQNALVQARQFHQAVGVTGLVLTKLDGTARGGIVIAIANELKIPIRYIGIGETPEDFGEFDAMAFATALTEGAPRRGEAGAA
jgi:fused signal recognition particle receptor